MIDFRYHLVSIVSIFLALAVGIVLGAGPLKEDIGNTLTQQTSVLRAEKSELRTELDAEKRGTAARDTFAADRRGSADRQDRRPCCRAGRRLRSGQEDDGLTGHRRCQGGVDDHVDRRVD